MDATSSPEYKALQAQKWILEDRLSAAEGIIYRMMGPDAGEAAIQAATQRLHDLDAEIRHEMNAESR